MKSLFTRVLPVVAALACAGCGKPHAPAAAVVQVAAPTLTLAAANTQAEAVVSGSVEARDHVELASRLSGYVTRVAVREGDTVQRGQLLLQIDPADVQAQLAQARAALTTAEAAAATTAADTQRYRALFHDDVIPRQQWEQQQLRDTQSRQQLAAARAADAQAAAQLGYAALRAPVAGVVVAKQVDAGDLATPGRTLLVLDGGGPLRVSSAVDDAVYAQLKRGDAASVRSENLRCDARIAQLVPSQDPVSHTHAVKLDLPAGCALRSGAFVRVGFAARDPHPQLRVPASALVERAGLQGVFVVNPDHSAAFRLLRLGARIGDSVDVQAGLQPGETVVTGHLDQVENGVQIVGAPR